MAFLTPFSPFFIATMVKLLKTIEVLWSKLLNKSLKSGLFWS